MGIKEKIQNAKKAYWLTEGLTEKEVKDAVESAQQLMEDKEQVNKNER